MNHEKIEDALIGIILGAGLALLLLLVGRAAFSESGPSTYLTIKITPNKQKIVTKNIDIISSVDNHDGTETTWIIACGSMVEVTYNQRYALEHTQTIKVAVQRAVIAACNAKYTDDTTRDREGNIVRRDTPSVRTK